MAKKQRASLVFDNSSFGHTFDSSMETYLDMSATCWKGLRKALNRYNPSEYNVTIDKVYGHSSQGNATYLMKFIDGTGSDTSITYEFKEQNGNYFLNVTCNPTIIAVGRNDIPIIIQGKDFKGINSSEVTLKYTGRLPYLILPRILKEQGFEWNSNDEKKILNGDISLFRYQTAWYSGDLGKDRKPLMLFLRAIYCGTDASKEYVRDILGSMGIHGRAWQNSEENLTIDVNSNKNKYLSCTIYCKDLDPKYVKMKGIDRLHRLIRWDCTLFSAFLSSNGIKKLNDLEKKFSEVCSVDAYDIGFVRFLAKQVQDRLNMPYLIRLRLEDYKKDIKELANSIGNTDTERKIIDHWLAYGEYSSKRELSKTLDIKETTLNSALQRVQEVTDINLSIPRSTHEAVLFNRENATLSMIERGERLLDINGTSNSAIKRIESVKRDKKNSESFSSVLEKADTDGPFKIRRFSPVKVKIDNLWIYRSPDFSSIKD